MKYFFLLSDSQIRSNSISEMLQVNIMELAFKKEEWWIANLGCFALPGGGG